MQKKHWIWLGIALSLCAVGVVLFVFLMPSPVERCDFTDCAVGVRAGWSSYVGDNPMKIVYTLTDEETAEFVECFKNVKTSSFAAHVIGIVGDASQFLIFKNSGAAVEITLYGEYLNIDGKYYKCDYEDCSALIEMVNTYAETHSTYLMSDELRQIEDKPSASVSGKDLFGLNGCERITLWQIGRKVLASEITEADSVNAAQALLCGLDYEKTDARPSQAGIPITFQTAEDAVTVTVCGQYILYGDQWYQTTVNLSDVFCGLKDRGA